VTIAGERDAIVTVSLIGTVLFAVTSIAALVVPAARPIAFVVAITLFVVGCGAFLWAYAIAVQRSRTDAIGIGGLYFLAGDTAPPPIRRVLLGCLATQVIVAVTAAALRPYSPLAFGILTPVFGLGFAGLWAARHGTFGPREPAGER
jgi:hypothetical protein